MAQYIVLKKKNKILTIEANKCNLKRARLIANNPFDRFAEYLICEVVESIRPNRHYENRESV